MDNYQCVAYGCMALRELQKRKEQVTEKSLKSELIYLLDMYSATEIYKRYQIED